MTNLEKALIEKLEEVEQKFEEQKTYYKDTFNQVVWYSNAVASIEDFIYMSGSEGKRFICMNYVSEENMPDEFYRILEYFKHFLEQNKEVCDCKVPKEMEGAE